MAGPGHSACPTACLGARSAAGRGRRGAARTNGDTHADARRLGLCCAGGGHGSPDPDRDADRNTYEHADQYTHSQQHADPHSQPACKHEHSNGYGHEHFGQCTNANAYRDGDTDHVPDSDIGVSDANSHGHTPPNKHANSEPHADQHTEPHADQHTEPHEHADAHLRAADSYPDQYAHCYQVPDSDAGTCHTDPHEHAQPDQHTDPESNGDRAPHGH